MAGIASAGMAVRTAPARSQFTTLNSEMRERWLSPEGKAQAAKVVRALSRGRDLARIGVDRFDGRFDLRGLIVEIPGEVATKVEGDRSVTDASKLWEFKGTTLSDLDLRGAILPHFRFFTAQIENCLFDNADLRGWRLWGTDVMDSSLRGADLRDTSLGGWEKGRGNVYERADFSGSNLSGVWTHAARFVECEFSQAKLDKAEFWGCEFIRCTFAGTLREVIFHRRFMSKEQGEIPLEPRLEDVDLSHTALRDCAIEVPVRGGALPSSDTHLIIRNFYDRLREVEARLKADDGAHVEAPLAWVRYLLREYEPEELELGILRREDFQRHWDEKEASAFFDALQ